MVKEFKDYDIKYSKLKGKLMDYELEAGITKEHIAEKCVGIAAWPLKVNAYTNAAIREAVYFEESAEEWQQFRVSLKGFSTKEKLWRLYNRLIWFGLVWVRAKRVTNWKCCGWITTSALSFVVDS